jgi:2-(1,2-epoxy-1,2-dihydrophenyl)acetyl-CoA isomerase
LAQAASASLTEIKTLCAGLPGRDLRTHLDLEHRLLVERARGADAREGVRAFLARRPPRFTGMG